jgi:hypothetical protein
MRIKWILLLFFFLYLGLVAEVKNQDNPRFGEGSVILEKIWSLEEIDEQVIGEAPMVMVREDGYIYTFLRRHNINYLLDPQGKLIRKFANRGEGPGEVKRQMGYYSVGEHLIIGDTEKLIYFTREGEYVKSLRNNNFRNEPVFFLNERQIVTTSKVSLNADDRKGYLRTKDLVTGEMKTIANFDLFKRATVGNNRRRMVLMSESLTPVPVVGNDSSCIYYGMNHTYRIHVSGLSGNQVSVFSLDRPNKKVSLEEKRKRFSRTRSIPESARDQFIKNLPDELTHFVRIEVHQKLLFIFPSYFNRKNEQQMDIFSKGGKYLYRTFVTLPKGQVFHGMVRMNPIIKDQYIYITAEDKEGEISFTKYKYQLPDLENLKK